MSDRIEQAARALASSMGGELSDPTEYVELLAPLLVARVRDLADEGFIAPAELHRMYSVGEKRDGRLIKVLKGEGYRKRYELESKFGDPTRKKGGTYVPIFRHVTEWRELG